MVLNFSYLAIKQPNWKSVDEKLLELKPRVSDSFDIKIVSRKKLLKVLAPPQAHFRWSFSVSKSRSVYKISQIIFVSLKLYFWSIHMLTISLWPFPSVSNWTVTLSFASVLRFVSFYAGVRIMTFVSITCCVRITFCVIVKFFFASVLYFASELRFASVLRFTFVLHFAA